MTLPVVLTRGGSVVSFHIVTRIGLYGQQNMAEKNGKSLLRLSHKIHCVHMQMTEVRSDLTHVQKFTQNESKTQM